MLAASLVIWTTLHYVRAPGRRIGAHRDRRRPESAAHRGHPAVPVSGHLGAWVDDIYITYPVPGRGGDWHGQARGLECGGPGRPPASAPGCVYLEGVAGYEAAIHAHAFAIVSLLGNHNMDRRDRDILAAVESTRGYAQISDEGSAPTFIYAPDYPAWERANPAAAAAAGAKPGR